MKLSKINKTLRKVGFCMVISTDEKGLHGIEIVRWKTFQNRCNKSAKKEWE